MKKGVFGILFLALMVVMGGASIAKYLKRNWSESSTSKIESENEIVRQSFVDLYPFNDEKNVPATKEGKPTLQCLSVYSQYAEHIKTGIEAYTNSEHPFSTPILRSLECMDELADRDLTIKGNHLITRLSNGYLTYPYPYSHPEKAWNNLRDFVKWLKSRDIKFFHLIAADKGDDSFGTIPEGIPQGYARMAEEYKAFLDKNSIDYLEAKQKMLAQNSDFYYWFYKADHHWNVHAGLLMAEESAKKLNELGVMADTDVVKKENFTLKVYPHSFIGSQGRAIESKYAEDMEVYYPKGETDIYVQIPRRAKEKRGSFNETLIDKQPPSSNMSYYSICHVGEPLIRIENKNSNNTSKVLVIGLSKVNIAYPYLALAVQHLDVIEIQYFDGSICTFIEKTRPDAVICCIDVPWEGGEDFWDLR